MRDVRGVILKNSVVIIWLECYDYGYESNTDWRTE